MDLGQVFTEKTVAEYMVSLLNLDKSSLILDPCFGEGAFIEALLSYGYHDITGIEIDKNLYEIVSKKYPDVCLYNSDFFNSDENILYDGIILNPPYVRQEKIDDLEEFGITKTNLRTKVPSKDIPRTANLYVYFILKAISLLKENGVMVVIFPGTWMATNRGKLFKNALLENCSLTDIIQVKGKAFTQKALVDVVILRIEKNGNHSSCKRKNAVIIGSSVKVTEIREEEFEDFGFPIPFKKIARIRRGLTTGFNEMFINPCVDLKNTQSIISTPKAIHGYTSMNADFDRLLCTDNVEECKDYIQSWECEIRKRQSPKTLYNNIIRGNPDWYKLRSFDCTGIIFSYFVRDNIKFIDNSKGYLIRDNFYIIYPNISSRLMFALLNNYYTYIQLESLGKLYGAGLLKLQRYDLEKIHFPKLDNFSNRDVERLEYLSDKLIHSGNADIIEEITHIISKYSNMSFSNVKTKYLEKKKMRLNHYAY